MISSKKTSDQVDLAYAYLSGFFWGNPFRINIEGLLISMGLEKCEWESMKKNYVIDFISEESKSVIDNFFNP